MRINGQTVGETYTRQVQLPRPDGSSLLLTLKPLPLSFHRRLRERGIVLPSPPTRVARDSRGKPIRDDRGLGLLVADEQDADYLSELERYHQRVSVLVVAESLQVDPNVQFDTKIPETSQGWADYADRLYAELEEAGWSVGDLIQLCDEVCRMSNLLDDHLRETHQNFSQAQPAEI